MHRLLPLFALLAFQGIHGATITLNCTSNPVSNDGGNGTFTLSCPGVNAGPNVAIDSATLTVFGDYALGLAPTNSVRFDVTPPPGLVGAFTGSNVVTGATASNAPAVMVAPLAFTGPVSGVGAFSFSVLSTLLQGDVIATASAANVLFSTSVYSSSSSNPLLPIFNSGGTGFVFQNVGSGGWFDPPLTSSYDYTGTGGTLFTSLTLPGGFGSFNIFTGSGFGNSLGSFAAGSSVDFLSLLGSAQSAFRISGISPLVDTADPSAFPVQIFFSTSSGSFTQTASTTDTPEPATWFGMTAGLGLLWARRKIVNARGGK